MCNGSDDLLIRGKRGVQVQQGLTRLEAFAKHFHFLLDHGMLYFDFLLGHTSTSCLIMARCLDFLLEHFMVYFHFLFDHGMVYLDFLLDHVILYLDL